SSTGAKHKSEGTTHVGKRLVTVAAVAILETCKNCRLDGRLKMGMDPMCNISINSESLSLVSSCIYVEKL
ncbi:MAG: hypothetical protein WB988_12345, partial [Candidatus Nitrosopolaris sp.]